MDDSEIINDTNKYKGFLNVNGIALDEYGRD